MEIDVLKELIKDSSNIVFFGGAGVSTESNIPDFRSGTGLYKAKNNKAYTPERMLSHSFFMENPEEFYEFYREKMLYEMAEPNAAHKTLAKLEEMGKLKAIITQNIDGLHQKAGSRKVLELHGTVHANFCVECGMEYDLSYIVNSQTMVPKCKKCSGIVKPKVVLYEEMLDDDLINESLKYISNADMLIVGGTSLVVYPAAGMISHFRGRNLVLINKSQTDYDSKASLVIKDSIGKVLEAAIK